jgi:hypothetical protein
MLLAESLATQLPLLVLPPLLVLLQPATCPATPACPPAETALLMLPVFFLPRQLVLLLVLAVCGTLQVLSPPFSHSTSG